MPSLGLSRTRREAAQPERVVEGALPQLHRDSAQQRHKQAALSDSRQRGCVSSSQQQSANERETQGFLNQWNPAGLRRNCHWKRLWRPSQEPSPGAAFPQIPGQVCIKDQSTRGAIFFFIH